MRMVIKKMDTEEAYQGDLSAEDCLMMRRLPNMPGHTTVGIRESD